jgi:hypothetical protein
MKLEMEKHCKAMLFEWWGHTFRGFPRCRMNAVLDLLDKENRMRSIGSIGLYKGYSLQSLIITIRL